MQLLALALLIGDTAAGLASRLAGSLALAATAVLGAFAQITGFDGLDMFHDYSLLKITFLHSNTTENGSQWMDMRNGKFYVAIGVGKVIIVRKYIYRMRKEYDIILFVKLYRLENILKIKSIF